MMITKKKPFGKVSEYLLAIEKQRRGHKLVLPFVLEEDIMFTDKRHL